MSVPSPLRRDRDLLWSAIAAIAMLPFAALPAQAIFQRLETKATTPCYHKLTRIPGIPYQCWQFEDPEATLPVWKYSLGFEFGPLTKAQWEKIAIAYASWRTADSVLDTQILPPYDAKKHYWLMDFMPPIMQATNRHRFRSQASTTKSNQTNASIIANCWGTLYEILRLRQASAEKNSYLMMVDPHTILSTLKTLSQPVTSAEPGDLLLISHQTATNSPSGHPAIANQRTSASPSNQTFLDHAALFIDKGLIFEKAGAGDNVPYRIVGLSTLQRIWRRDVFDHQVRRPIANLQMPYPLSFSLERVEAPMTVIADHDPQNPSQQYYSIFQLPPLIKADGRGKLPPQLFNPDYYRRTVNQSDNSD